MSEPQPTLATPVVSPPAVVAETTVAAYAAIRPAALPAPHRHHVVYPTVLDTVRSLLSVIIFALFVLTFIVQPFRIPSESMEHTLLVGDFLLVNKMIYAPAGVWKRVLPYEPVKRGDIVVFHFPLDPTDHVVKRVVAIPGDRVHLHDGVVFLNAQQLNEPYAAYETSYADNFRDQFPTTLYTDPGVDTHWWMEMRHDIQNGDLIVPPGRYFALGDNRNHSRDSRYWGFVPQQNIVGRPFVIYFSLRQPSTTSVPDLPDDRLGHDKDPVNSIVDFARWDRMFRVVW
ncbi:signal peptidase I [Acidobacterium sp. S8]|uniref:signal peptidase I n=1 Tax=Acidobacterium sp. S8 TaxID=1641854 RepID=UPI00131B48D1|nr:signal peptidase I [Acidobacterium sp. S8]